MLSRSSIHLVGKLNLAYSYIPVQSLPGRCPSCEMLSLSVKKSFDSKEFSVNEVESAFPKSIRRRINILI